MQSKRGQGLPLNTIIIAIIVIVVLVIIIIIFSGNILNFQKSANTGSGCRQAGGTCVSSSTCHALGGVAGGTDDCGDSSVICCVSGVQQGLTPQQQQQARGQGR